MKNLAIVQIILGILVIGSLVWFIGWIEYDYSSFTEVIEHPVDGSTVEIEMHPVSGWVVRMISWNAASFVLGISVLGLGIAQFVKARGLKGAEPL